MNWTPRPPHPEEPACWSWPVPPVEDEQTAAARVGQEMPTLGAEDIAFLLRAGLDTNRFSRFHQGRCGVCGISHGETRMVDDHCHQTGQSRGPLCQGCNTSEGTSLAPVFVRYRRIHPAAILDYHAPYTGRGWQDGWWGHDILVAERNGYQRRPPTPWPVWNPDAPLDQLQP